MSEKFESRESVNLSREDVISFLKENPSDFSLLQRLISMRETQIRDSKTTLAFSIELAEIYRDAGLVEFAREAFQRAAEHAWQEREDGLYEKLMGEIDKLNQNR